MLGAETHAYERNLHLILTLRCLVGSRRNIRFCLDTECRHLSQALNAHRLDLAGGLRPCYLISTSQDCHNPNFERKFLVFSDAWRNSAIRHTKIRQAYLDSNAKVSIRVRINDDSSATLTLKSRSSKLRRREFEYAIPTLDADELISLRRSYVIEKVRHIVPYGDLNWEVDVFSGENQGLVVAEIELPDENHQIELPS